MPAVNTASDLNEKRLRVFLGAGVSFNAGMPLALEYVSEVFRHLGLRPRARQALLNVDLPFEAVMQSLIEVTGIDGLVAPFLGGTPTRTHQFIAVLAARGAVAGVMTTNVDQLQEMACEAVGVPIDSRSTDMALAVPFPDTTGLPLYKLHGDVGDTESLAVTIRRVATETGVEARAAAVERFWSSPDADLVLVLGYSFSDRFDINPALVALSGPSLPVLLVDHMPGARETKEEPLGALPSDHPLHRFDGFRLQCDCDEFIAQGWRDRLGEEPPALRRDPPLWRDMIADWYAGATNAAGTAVGLYLAGTLLQAAALYRLSTRYLLAATRGPLEAHLVAMALQRIGDNFRNQDRMTEALASLQAALSAARDAGASSVEAESLNSMGMVYEAMKQHEAALACYRRARKRARRFSLRELEGRCSGNTGIVFKNMGGNTNLERSLRHYQMALAIAKRLGDKRSEGRTLGNMGIATSDLGDKLAAVELYERARTIAQDLRDPFHIAVWHGNAGMDLEDIDPHRSRHHLEEAIRVFSRLGQSHWVRECQTVLDRLAVEDRSP